MRRLLYCFHVTNSHIQDVVYIIHSKQNLRRCVASSAITFNLIATKMNEMTQKFKWEYLDGMQTHTHDNSTESDLKFGLYRVC